MNIRKLFLSSIPLITLCTARVAFPDCPAGEKIDLKEFFLSVQGSYEIETAGGVVPKKDVRGAEVTWDAEEVQASLTLPYCEAELCSPGYVSLPAAKTEACEETLADGRLLHTFYVTDAIPPKKYGWRVDATGKVHFKNFQHRSSDRKTTTFEHVLVRNKTITP